MGSDFVLTVEMLRTGRRVHRSVEHVAVIGRYRKDRAAKLSDRGRMGFSSPTAL